MIDGLKPYPAYKDSGVPWLGQVPEHWEVRRTKTVLRERNVRGFPNEPLLAATQTKGVIRKEQYENRTVLALKDLHLLKLVEIGDFVISLRSFQGGIEYARERGIISPAYTILYPQENDYHAYLAFLFKSSPYIENLQLFVTGIRQGQNIDYETLSRSPLPLPPLPEQTAIVRFLDYMERRIRRVIHARQRQIKLLEEYRQALIHQAVTGHIDVRTGKPYPAYKDSGVPWLGQVPEHWEVRRLGASVTACINGIWGGDPDGSYDLPCVRVADFDRDRRRVRMMHPTVRSIPPKDRAYRLLRQGDLLLEKSGGGDQQPVGMVVLYDHQVEAVCSNFIARMPVSERYDPSFLNYLHATLYAIQLNVRSIKQTTGIQNLDSKAYLNEPVAFPPLPEQTAIVEYLDVQTAKIDAAIAAARREIELLREYRERLIADVVTGKVDVREVAARLPEEPPEDGSDGLDPLDEVETLASDGHNEEGIDLDTVA
jgi:type I restriction enzyme S subunit